MDREFKSWLLVLGLLFTASSLVSFVQNVGQISLYGFLALYLKFYREAAHPLIGLLPSLLRLDAPGWLKDLWTLSGTFTAILLRANYLLGQRPRPVEALDESCQGIADERLAQRANQALTWLRLTAIAGVSTYMLIGLLLPWLVMLTGTDGGFWRTLAVLYLSLLVMAVLATLAFFLMNGFVGYVV